MSFIGFIPFREATPEDFKCLRAAHKRFLKNHEVKITRSDIMVDTVERDDFYFKLYIWVNHPNQNHAERHDCKCLNERWRKIAKRALRTERGDCGYGEEPYIALGLVGVYSSGGY